MSARAKPRPQPKANTAKAPRRVWLIFTMTGTMAYVFPSKAEAMRRVRSDYFLSGALLTGPYVLAVKP